MRETVVPPQKNHDTLGTYRHKVILRSFYSELFWAKVNLIQIKTPFRRVTQERARKIFKISKLFVHFQVSVQLNCHEL